MGLRYVSLGCDWGSGGCLFCAGCRLSLSILCGGLILLRRLLSAMPEYSNEELLSAVISPLSTLFNGISGRGIIARVECLTRYDPFPFRLANSGGHLINSLVILLAFDGLAAMDDFITGDLSCFRYHHACCIFVLCLRHPLKITQIQL